MPLPGKCLVLAPKSFCYTCCQVNYDLVEALVAHVVGVRQAEAAQQGAAAAILFFAPGAEEINRICRAVQVGPGGGRNDLQEWRHYEGCAMGGAPGELLTAVPCVC